ncbi:thiamine diphosphokinase [Mangrovicella endophytica]|uniref:thiamine diphosphokinase n=1 Tax=Mangrovicella endophytica TaxID=2066697 RepID=UPI000C9DF4D1|nr:thiamine diphosphokinase [Mangrovicella endophytica]
MSHFAVLLAGPITATTALRATLTGARVIAADAGIRHAATLGLTPELWVGDFDSAGDDPEYAGFAGVPRQTFPRDKDQTDGELAIDIARERGASRLTLVGASGGPRSDHAFSHLVLALRHAEAGISVELFDGREHAWPLLPGRQRFPMDAGSQFSILKFTDLAGLSIRGARFPLEDAAIPFSSILTQSNEATGPVEVTLRSGRAILLAQADSAVR